MMTPKERADYKRKKMKEIGLKPKVKFQGRKNIRKLAMGGGAGIVTGKPSLF